jgi:hypothetical protein
MFFFVFFCFRRENCFAFQIQPEHLSVNDWSEKECYLFSHGVLPLKSYQNNKVIRKVAKTQGSHLEFGKNSEMVSRNKGENYRFRNAPISVLS